MRKLWLLLAPFLYGCAVQNVEDCSRYAVLSTAYAVAARDWRVQTLEKMDFYFVLRRIECSLVVKKQKRERGFVPTP